jgi:4-alpha-glucanotransferase
MEFKRSSGILLHPTSFPGPYGIGDLGPEAFRWIDFLAEVGCSLWQVLPLGPTGYGDSPYQSFSSFAGNPYLISPDLLISDQLLAPQDLLDRPEFPEDQVDFGALIPWKLSILDHAFQRFQSRPDLDLHDKYRAFQEKHAAWLHNYALFMAIKEIHDSAPWSVWAKPLRHRDPGAIAALEESHASAVLRQKFYQFLFFRQWSALRSYANAKGILIIGDVPIFVAMDSADVWANTELFHLDEEGLPSVVAGVPPDYFSPTGQLWGNPLYRWEVHAASGFAWWLARLKSVFSLVDVVRLDHFRGFAGYWEVPAGSETAEHGRWVPGPGKSFFDSVMDAFGVLPIIAEDLGEITPDVIALRDELGLPGMKILVFAFTGEPDNPFLPHQFDPNCVVYTGTHDNDTAVGWYKRVEPEEQAFYRRFRNSSGKDVSNELIRMAWESVAVYALAPMQDFLGFGNEARMNYPGRPSGNWTWRMPIEALGDGLRVELTELNFLFNRSNMK